MELIAPDQEHHIKDYRSAKDFWDRLKAVHQTAHTGIAAFYMKVGMIKREFVEGESMQSHIDFLLGKNKKLATSKQAFNDEFMAQLILMSLPSPLLWDTIIVTLLQSVSDTKKLSTTDVTARLLQEATWISGPNQSTSNAALYVKNKPQSKKKKKTCGFCSGGGHTEEVCRKKIAAMEKEWEKQILQEKEKEKANTVKMSDSSVESSESEDTDIHVNVALAKSSKTFPSDDYSDFIAVFAANPITANVTNPTRDDILLDSGCTCHMSPQRDWFEAQSFIQLTNPVEVHLGDDRVIHATGKGTLEFSLEVNGKTITGRFPNTLYVPKLATTLISAYHIIRNENTIELDITGCRIISKPLQRVIGEGELTPTSLYRLKASPINSKIHAKMCMGTGFLLKNSCIMPYEKTYAIKLLFIKILHQNK